MKEQLTDLREYLAELKKAKENKKAALDNYNEAVARYGQVFVPLEGDHPDKERIRRLLSICPEDSAYPRSHLLVCLALLFHAPEALFGGKLPMRLAKRIAEVLGVKHEAVYIARNKVSGWLRIYPDFLEFIERLFEASQDDGGLYI